MRTTLAIDDDVLAAAKAIAQQQRRSIGEVVSELARRACIDHRRPRSATASPCLRAATARPSSPSRPSTRCAISCRDVPAGRQCSHRPHRLGACGPRRRASLVRGRGSGGLGHLSAHRKRRRPHHWPSEISQHARIARGRRRHSHPTQDAARPCLLAGRHQPGRRGACRFHADSDIGPGHRQLSPRAGCRSGGPIGDVRPPPFSQGRQRWKGGAARYSRLTASLILSAQNFTLASTSTLRSTSSPTVSPASSYSRWWPFSRLEPTSDSCSFLVASQDRRVSASV